VVQVSLLAAIIILLSAWRFLHVARESELSTLKSMLRGSDILSAERIIRRPSLIRMSVIREWVFSIEPKQFDALKRQCSAAEDRFPRNAVESQVGCIAASYSDATKSRYVTLTARPATAAISAMYMSESEFHTMLNASFSSDGESVNTAPETR
jgi:hypothetical protein